MLGPPVGAAWSKVWTEGFAACPTVGDLATAGTSACSGMPYKINVASIKTYIYITTTLVSHKITKTRSISLVHVILCRLEA